MPTRDVRPPDLEMRVRTVAEHGRTRLSYTLHSPTGAVDFVHREIVGLTFQGSPESFQEHLLHKMEHLLCRQDIDGSWLDPEELERKLTGLGQNLWRDLMPPEIRQAYRAIRRSVRSWMIVSDEPWIPWELIKPYDSSLPDDVIDDDFLALQFELTRWLAGDKTPARQITIRQLAAFRTAKDLPHAKQEKAVLRDILQSHPDLLDATPAVDSAGAVLRCLETCNPDLLHFIGHGVHTAAQPEESAIPFPDRSVLRPVDLEGPLATRIGLTRPLVFLNACGAGQQGWSLTRLGGWAARWVSVCGCGAFVAPMWPVRDKTALAFAEAFYGALAGGATLGEAALAARRHVVQARPGDPSILAYTVYGHPNARVLFGGSTSSEATLAVEPPRAYRLQRARPRPRLPLRWVWPAAAICGVALMLHFAAAPILDFLFPIDQPPQQAAMTAMTLKKPVPASGPASPRPKSRTATSTAVGGLRFEIDGGEAGVNYALKQELSRAARPITEEGISGWTITVKLARPNVESHTQDGFDMKICRLTAEAGAKGRGSLIDLGPINVVNSQFDGTQACEAAAGSLADAVVSRLVTAIGTKGES